MIAFQSHYAFGTDSYKGVSAARLTPGVLAVDKALPWVVNIGTMERLQVDDSFNLFFNEFFNPHYSVQTQEKYFPLGSGVIIDERGLVLTNSHVVQRASAIEIRLWNGEEYKARIVGFDVPNDLCLLQILGDFNGKPFKAASFAKMNDLILGETVMTIGNPFGLEHSVSSGVLSATNRGFSDNNISFTDIIQTDASINPGNSGGPLINLDGDLIGINLAIRADAQGIGFAIPLARIEKFLSFWMKPSHFSSAYLGLAPGGIPESGENGILLPEITENSPFDKAGLKPGTEIIAVNGHSVTRPIDFARETYSLTADETVTLRTADQKDIQLTLETMPAAHFAETRLGMKLDSLSDSLRQALAISNDEFQGMIITEIIKPEFFSMERQQWQDILKRGDIVTKIEGESVNSLDDIVRLLSSYSSGDVITMEVYSINQTRRTFRPFSFKIILK